MEADNNHFFFLETLRILGWLCVLYSAYINRKNMTVFAFWWKVAFVIMCFAAIYDEASKNNFDLTVKSLGWYPAHFTLIIGLLYNIKLLREMSGFVNHVKKSMKL